MRARSEMRACSKLGDGAEDVEEHASDGDGGVDTLVEHHQDDAAVVERLGQLDQVLERSAEAVELSDDELIADSSALSSCGREAILPEALSMKISSQPAAVSASC